MSYTLCPNQTLRRKKHYFGEKGEEDCDGDSLVVVTAVFTIHCIQLQRLPENTNTTR